MAPARRTSRVARRGRGTGASRVRADQSRCFEAVDSSTLRIPAATLLRGQPPRDLNSQAARLASQFISQNGPRFAQIGVEAGQQYDGNTVDVVLRTSTQVGAVPLLSPVTGRHDFGLVIKPRFDWPGLGPMLAEMGWRIIPKPLPLPLLPRSDRKIPPWVLSTVVLFRIKQLLDQLERRFEIVSAIRPAPRGTVDWARYATQHMGRADFMSVPCRFPDLRDDRELRAGIRFTLQRQLQGLDGQRTAGVFVLRLIALCQQLIERVRDVAPREPTARQIDAWFRGSLQTDAYRDGIQAIEWTADERGLAGLSDLQGLPWIMSMEVFFEAWVETVLAAVARRIGGVLKTGRKRTTLAPLDWDPPYVGSQRYLLPDMMLERGETTIIVDAKYKEHWEELQDRRWGELEAELRERHRADLLQVLAYANVATTPHVVVCLAYPCARETWASLIDRQRLVHRASLRAGEKRVDLVLTAVPMGVAAREVAHALAPLVVGE
jgi:McrBC 5-methylcytosine restriction system component